MLTLGVAPQAWLSMNQEKGPERLCRVGLFDAVTNALRQPRRTARPRGCRVGRGVDRHLYRPDRAVNALVVA